jgi:hypothetical protein
VSLAAPPRRLFRRHGRSTTVPPAKRAEGEPRSVLLGPVEALPPVDGPGRSSAGLRSKVIPAIWATLIEAAATAGPEVEYAVRAHLSDIGYDLDREAARVAERAPKALRWIGEMEESAKAMRELGLPAGFSEGAAAAYRRIADEC